jgi:short-subunit dehydrogenase involved in D-alanine esterification of teichoic acids
MTNNHLDDSVNPTRREEIMKAQKTVLDQARREMEVNYFGPLQLLQRLAPTLARKGGA